MPGGNMSASDNIKTSKKNIDDSVTNFEKRLNLLRRKLILKAWFPEKI